MGRAYSAEIDKQMPVESNPAVNDGVRVIVKKLLQSNGLEKKFEWDVKVIRDDKTVNAFALPGGKIYVFTGLIAAADDEAEVAGVLAHEIAHVTERHSAERMTDAAGVQVIAQVLLGNRGALTQTAAQVVTQVGFLAYSRGQESEADEVGLEYLVKTDYDPQGMPRFFEKIRKLAGKDPSAVERFLSDHPDSAERAKLARKRIAKLPPAEQKGETYAERWAAYKNVVFTSSRGGS
jgi:predicted Zn-dependent protease